MTLSELKQLLIGRTIVDLDVDGDVFHSAHGVAFFGPNGAAGDVRITLDDGTAITTNGGDLSAIIKES